MKRAPASRHQRDNRRPNAENRKRYYTARWRKLRKFVLARDRGLCQQCLRKGKIETGNQIDHIERAEDRPDLFWRSDNLQVLCVTCHQKKTASGS